MSQRLFFWRFWVLIAISLMISSAQAQINGGMSGSFYNPDNDGTGLNIEILSDSFGIAYWYTYDLDGNQRWHLLTGDILGSRMTGEMFSFEGMVFGEFDPAFVDQHVFGNFSIEFSDCNNLTFQYSPSAVQPDGRFYPSGQLDMQRLTTPLGVAEQCGGTGGVAARSAVSGIYAGEVRPDGFPNLETIVLITESGVVAGVSDVGMYFGVVSVSGSNFAGSVTAVTFGDFVFTDGDAFAVVDLSGTRDGNVLSFNYQARSRGGDQIMERGVYVGESLALYEFGLTQNTLAGSWRSDLGYRFEVDEAGRVSGSGPGACRYHGTIRPEDSRFNAATGRLLPANCVGVDGTVELTLIQDEEGLLVIASGDQFYFDIWRR